MELKLPIIRTVEEFKKRIKVGDEFWSITSYLGKGPVGLDHCVVESYQEVPHHWGTNNPPTLTAITAWDLDYGYRRDRFVVDIINSSHGAFTSLHEAKKGLEAAKELWNSNPEWQEREKLKAKEFYEFIDDLDSECYGDDE
jgi:hypothetical protein